MPQPVKDGNLTIVLGGFGTEAEAVKWATDPKTEKLRPNLVVKPYDIKLVSHEPGWEATEGASVWREDPPA
jgi:hypothetical protein